MTDSCPEYIKRYCETLKNERGYAGHSVSAYYNDLLQLALLLQRHGIATWAQVQTPQIRQCINLLRRDNIGTRSMARKISAWRGFFSWLLQQEIITTLPTSGIRAPKISNKPLPKALPIDTTQKLLDHPPPLPKDSALTKVLLVRDQAMFELLYASGLRVSELVSLDVNVNSDSESYLRPQRKNLRVRGKGNKTREVPVGNKAWQAVNAWLAQRPLLDRNNCNALFLGARGKRINRHEVARRLKQYGSHSGLKVHPHMLRHSFASHLLQSSGNIRAVQELLGHRSLTSTQVYTALDIQYLNAIYQNTHPRAKRGSRN